MVSASLSRSLGVPCTSGRIQPLRATSRASGTIIVRAGAAAPTAAPYNALAVDEPRPAEYAVISTPTGQQLVEEGKWFALCSEGALKASSGDGQLRFPAVAVKRTDGEFVKGKPFLADWVVEAEIVEEQAFALQGGNSASGSSNLLGKVLVTKIKHTEETLRLIEEALRV